MVQTVSISGSIGVGKTTLAAGLTERLQNAYIVPENVGTLKFLPLFYADRSHYALHSRLEFLVVKARQLASVKEADNFAILDRSLPELITFARALLRLGIMPERDFELYEGIYNLVADKCRPIDIVLWARASPEVMLSRIKTRGRTFEQDITHVYLEAIDDEYEHWFAALPTKKKFVVDTSVLGQEAVADMAATWLKEAAM